MAPTFQAVGTPQTSTGASVNVPWPTHLTNDIGLVVIETSGNSATLTPPAGWAAVPGTPVTDVATIAGSKLHVWWKRAASSAEAAVATGAATDHIIARLYTFRGCVTTGNPWDVTTTGIKTTASTTATVPSLITTVDDTLVVMVVGRPNDNASTTHFGVPVNANLTGLAEHGEAGTTNGNGGGFVVSSGIDATAGSTGTSTLTKIASTTDTYVALALKAPVIYTIDGILGTFALNGVNTTLLANFILNNTVSSFALNGTLTGLEYTLQLNLTTDNYSVVGNNIALLKQLQLVNQVRAFNVAGTNTGLLATRQLINQVGQFTLTGISTDLDYIFSTGFTLDCLQGALVWSGINVNLTIARELIATKRSFDVVPVNIGLFSNRLLNVNAGALTLVGISSDIAKFLNLGGVTGAFNLTGVPLNALYSRNLVATTLPISLIGTVTEFNKQLLLNATANSFVLGLVSADFARQYEIKGSNSAILLSTTDTKLLQQRLLSTAVKEFSIFNLPGTLIRQFPLDTVNSSFVLNTTDLDYFAYRTLNAQKANLELYIQTKDIVYRPNRAPDYVTPIPQGRNQWILGKFTSGGKGSFRL